MPIGSEEIKTHYFLVRDLFWIQRKIRGRSNMAQRQMLNHPHYWYFCIFEFKYLSENWSIISINAFQRFATEFLTSLNISGSCEVPNTFIEVRWFTWVLLSGLLGKISSQRWYLKSPLSVICWCWFVMLSSLFGILIIIWWRRRPSMECEIVVMWR